MDSSYIQEENIRLILDQLRGSPSTNQLARRQIEELVSNLPRLTEQKLTSTGHQDSFCPICFTPFLALLAEEEMALAMDSPAQSSDNSGVTQLAQAGQCGHVFCRRDISKWITDAHDSCPICRRLFIPTSIDSTINLEAESETRLHDQMSSDPLNTFMRNFGAFGESATTGEQNRDEYAGMYA